MYSKGMPVFKICQILGFVRNGVSSCHQKEGEREDTWVTREGRIKGRNNTRCKSGVKHSPKERSSGCGSEKEG